MRAAINAFNASDEFVAALDDAARHKLPRAPELLAKYINLLLCKGSARKLDGGEHETALRDAMLVFELLDDKDVFQKFYSRLLAKRLIHSASVSDDAEKQVLADLKRIVGFEYTAKLQRMFQDIGTSRDVMAAFDDWRRVDDANNDDSDRSLSHDVSVLVLTTGAWPISASQSPFVLPTAVARSEALFRQFYNSMHSGRRLTWLRNMSKADVRALCWARRYELTCSAYQMAALLLFNELSTYTLADFMRAF